MSANVRSRNNSVTMQFPQSLLQQLQNHPGFNQAAFLAAHNKNEAVTSIRINPVKCSTAALESEINQSINQPINLSPVPWNPHGYYLSARPQFIFDPLLHAGAYYVQEASSMFLWQALQQCVPSTQNKNILDLCAAPGGKSTLIAGYAPNAFIVSNEVIKTRATILVENITKWGAPNVVVTNNDPADFARLPGFFDAIVVDAPCSGSGLFRKDENAINEWSEDSVLMCSRRQQRILADALPCLKEDGVLIYSTCSYSVEEDEEIADWLAGEMDMENIALTIPSEWDIVETQSPKHNAKGYRFYPHLIKGEGFYISVFKKKKSEGYAYYNEATLDKPSKKETEIIHNFYAVDDAHALFKNKEQVRIFPAAYLQQLQVVLKNLYVKKAGIAIGEIKHSDVIPDHELAVSGLNLQNLASIDADYDTALNYLKRKDIQLSDSKGWQLLTYKHLPMGWVKVLPNRVNNYYPVSWRILKE